MAVLYEERFVSAGRNELRQETLAVKGLRCATSAVKGLKEPDPAEQNHEMFNSTLAAFLYFPYNLLDNL